LYSTAYSTYQFEVFSEDLVQLQKLHEETPRSREPRIKKFALKSFISRIGNLKKETLYRTNDNAVLAESTNRYLHDMEDEEYEEALAQFDHQGVVQQAFHEYKEIKELDGRKEEKGTVMMKADYPSILLESTISKSKTGIVSTTQNLAFDFYSGSVTKSLTTDSYGKAIVTEHEPAYLKYEPMGLKVHDSGNKHMLSQIAGAYVYQVQPNDFEKRVGLLSASVQTWSNQVAVTNVGLQEGIWRKQASYNWNGQGELNGNGTHSYEEFENHQFKYEGVSQVEQWQKTGETTLYSGNSHTLEVKDINGNSATAHTDPLQAQILASATNAAFHEVGFSGAEYPLADPQDGEVSLGEGTPSISRGHTGQFSLQVAFNSEGFNKTLHSDQAQLNKKYKASVWVYLPGASETADEIKKAQLYYRVNGEEYVAHPVLQKNKSKSWYLIELDIDSRGAEEVYIGCRNRSSRAVYFDDFRIHPIDAAMTSYVYDPASGELTHILDENNIYTRFEYNAMGRLVRTSREMMNFDYGEGEESYRADRILQEVIYNYGENN
jgi:YD repeat-containing protein